MFLTTMGIPIPSATTALSGIGDYAKPMWDEFMPITLYATGIIMGVFLIVILVHHTKLAISQLIIKREQEKEDNVWLPKIRR